jgi:L-seryl-tRNA(Ser) seleniumtransferase
MADVAHRHGVIVLDDLGSGTLLPTAAYGLAPEPTVQESIAAGADLVTFSGDKLLGGPQAGLIVGREHLIAQLRAHPLARALRIDKTTLAGLAATLLSYVNQRTIEELPVWRMISANPVTLRARAQRISDALGIAQAAVVECTSAVGGGSLPGETLPSYAVALLDDRPDELARRMRRGDPPVVGRILDGRFILDVRTVLEEQEDDVITAARAALMIYR